jgi:hypothetical protein
MTTDATTPNEGEVEFEALDVMGPIDFLVVEFPHRTSPGPGVPIFIDLVDRGIIRVLDLAFVHKQPDGTFRRVSLAELGPELAVFEGASTGLLDDSDIANVAGAIGTDSTAVVLIFENHWAASLARTMRQGGGQLVATGRLPLQGILAALDATEGQNSN